MSEVEQTDNAVAGSITAGALLRTARESQGLHIGALAVSLKVPVSKLEALEAGQLDELSGSVFARALASSVCRNLKIDPAPVLAHLPQAVTSQLHQKGDLNAPFRGEGRGPSLVGGDRAVRPLGLAVAALLLGALVLVFLPNLRRLMPASNPAPAAVVGASPNANPGNSQPVPASDDGAASESISPASAVPTPLPTPTPSASGVVAAPIAATGDELLRFKASGDSWVEVTDAKGNVLLRKLLHAGESVPLGATPPVKVVVGRVDATEVSVRGQVKDLKGQSKDNVARFEVQ